MSAWVLLSQALIANHEEREIETMGSRFYWDKVERGHYRTTRRGHELDVERQGSGRWQARIDGKLLLSGLRPNSDHETKSDAVRACDRAALELGLVSS